MPPTVEAQSPNQWTAREVPYGHLYSRESTPLELHMDRVKASGGRWTHSRKLKPVASDSISQEKKPKQRFTCFPNEGMRRKGK